jgi:hypothetical protein
MARRCNDDFDIMLIDDTSFAKLLPDWTHGDISRIIQPRKTRLREIGLASLIYKYGGMILPGSFVCARNLIGLYNDSLENTDMFVGAIADTGTFESLPVATRYTRSANILGARKGAAVLQEFIEELGHGIHHDLLKSEYTRPAEVSKWLSARTDIAETRLTGFTDVFGKEITIERLFSDADIELSIHDYGLLLPGAAILRRRKYGWFAQLTATEILASQVFAAKYIAAALYETQYDIQ